MISQQLLDLLVCPETKQSLSLLSQSEVDKINQKIANKLISNRGGNLISEAISGALMREDKKYVYPIRDDIPIMLIEESFDISAFSEC